MKPIISVLILRYVDSSVLDCAHGKSYVERTFHHLENLDFADARFVDVHARAVGIQNLYVCRYLGIGSGQKES